MLSRIFKRGTKGEDQSELPPSTPGKFDEMAVRRSSRIASAQGTPVSEVGSPATTKKRSAEAAASPITQKKQRKLPVRNKDGERDGETHTHLEIVMPLKHDGVDSAASDEDGKDESEVNGNETEESDEEPEEEVEEKSSKSKSSKTKNKKEKPTVKPVTEASKPKHKRFGSEEPATEIPAIAEVAEEVMEEEDEEEDSDDDAPEEVGAQEATKAAQKLSLKAAKAAEGLEAELRKKRKDRDTFLKTQAEKKRKAEEALNDVGHQITRQDSKTSDPSTATLTKDPRPLNAKYDRSSLPEYLPVEFLEDEDTPMLDEPAQISQQKPRKIKFSDVYEKKPKDRTVGSTTVRVAEKVDRHLAPKAAKNARSTKEAWLAGRSGKGGAGGDNRRPVSSGFFKSGPAKR